MLSRLQLMGQHNTKMTRTIMHKFKFGMDVNKSQFCLLTCSKKID